MGNTIKNLKNVCSGSANEQERGSITIPTQLCNPEFRFVLLGKWNDIKQGKDGKPIYKGKAPFEKEWQTKNNYKFDDTKLLNHSYNFGVIGGYGNLRILDIDNKELAEEFEKKLNTYTIKTGSGGRHFYFISDYHTNHVLINKQGELRANNYQVVSAPCKHPSGNYYEVIKDVPIKKISSDELLNLIKPYLREEQTATTKPIENKGKDTSRSGLEFRKLIALFRAGKTRAEAVKEMQAYAKWVSAPEQYRQHQLDNAESFVLNEQEKEEKQEANAPTEEALNILKNPELFNLITEQEFDKKIVGEFEARKTIFLVTCMRLVENLNKATDNLILNAISGSGKDYVTEAIFDIIPEKEKEELIRISPKVLAYTRNKALNPLATWKGVALRLEDVGNDVLNDDAFKVMASANPNKINYSKIVNKGKIIEIQIEGKPSIILTIANANPREEQLRRFPICYLDEGINQTKEILRRQGEYAQKGITTDYNLTLIEALRCLKRVKVKIPYAEKLVYLFNAENVIARTHFPRFLDYIKTSCALYQHQRKIDDEGYYIAEPEDYDIARIVLIKTTSNILMIPLSKLQRSILDIFETKNLQKKSLDDMQEIKEIEKLNITDAWLRKQLDYLASKTFLNKDKEKRMDEAGKIIPKPIFIYSYNPLQKLEIPEFKDIKDIENDLITINKKNTINTIIAINTPSNNSKNSNKLGTGYCNIDLLEPQNSNKIKEAQEFEDE